MTPARPGVIVVSRSAAMLFAALDAQARQGPPGAARDGGITMGTIMDMHTGDTPRTPGSEYDDEVLNANWLPCPDADASPQGYDCCASHDAPPALDADSFLDAYYRNQE